MKKQMISLILNANVSSIKSISSKYKTLVNYLSVRTNPNRIDWNNPLIDLKLFRKFSKNSFRFTKFKLQFLYLVSGITKKTYPGIEYYLK